MYVTVANEIWGRVTGCIFGGLRDPSYFLAWVHPFNALRTLSYNLSTLAFILKNTLALIQLMRVSKNRLYVAIWVLQYYCQGAGALLYYPSSIELESVCAGVYELT